MAALKTLGDWLKRSDWVIALVQAEVATAGTAESFLRAAHEHTRSQLLPCTFSSNVPMTTTASSMLTVMSPLWTLNPGAIRGKRILYSSSTGQQYFQARFPLLCFDGGRRH